MKKSCVRVARLIILSGCSLPLAATEKLYDITSTYDAPAFVLKEKIKRYKHRKADLESARESLLSGSFGQTAAYILSRGSLFAACVSGIRKIFGGGGSVAPVAFGVTAYCAERMLTYQRAACLVAIEKELFFIRESIRDLKEVLQNKMEEM